MLGSGTPNDFMNKLASVQNKYVKAGGLTNNDLLTIAIINVPKDYKSLMTGAVSCLV